MTCDKTRQGSGGNGQGKRDKILYGDMDALEGRTGEVDSVLMLSWGG